MSITVHNEFANFLDSLLGDGWLHRALLALPEDRLDTVSHKAAEHVGHMLNHSATISTMLAVMPAHLSNEHWTFNVGFALNQSAEIAAVLNTVSAEATALRDPKVRRAVESTALRDAGEQGGDV